MADGCRPIKVAVLTIWSILPVIVLGAVNLQISGNTEVAEPFKLVCSSPLTNFGQTVYTFVRSPTPGDVGTSVGTIGYFPNTTPPCHDRGIDPIPYPFGCEDNGKRGYITVNVTTGTSLTEHDKYWRCVTLVDTVAAENNEVHVIIYDPVKTVHIVDEDGTTLTSPVVISESSTNTKLLCTTGPSGSRPEAQLTWWRVGTPAQQITSGVIALSGQQLTGKHVTARSTINVANRAFDGVSVFCKSSLNGGNTQSDKVLLSVTFSPEVKLKPEQNIQPTPDPYNILLGQNNVGLRCEVVDSNPPPSSYTWSVNNSVIEGAVQETYNIAMVSLQTAGTYRCRGNNGIGDPAFSSLELDVQYGPVIDPIINQNKEEGAPLSVPCRYTSNPPTNQLRWTKVDNTTFSQNQNSLTISPLHRSDSGRYRCSVTNTLHLSGKLNEQRTAWMDVYLDVQFSPEVQLTPEQNIQPTPDPYNILLGQNNVGLRCGVVDSNPPPSSYTWSVNNSVIEGAVQETYNIAMVTLQTAGTYICRGNNGIGDPAFSSLDLDVQYGPVIDPIIRQTKEEGAPLSVPCRYTAYPPTNQVRWTKVDNNTFSQNQSSLTIWPLHRSDSGMYRCSVTNTLHLSGKPNEQRTAWMDVYLDIQYGPVIDPIINQTKEEGAPLYVPCRYTSNPPTNQVRWTKVDNNTFSQYQSSLTISPLHRFDSGMYRCSVTNTLHLSGKPYEQRTAWMDVYLDVQYQPSITSLYVEGNNNVVSEHDLVKITCETDSNPTSAFTWTRQSDLASLQETENMLTLSSVQCSDTTFFTCTANNNIGSAATKNVQLFVQCQPRIYSIAAQETASGAVGESINITVQHIIAFPPPVFLWRKANGDTLPPSTQTDTNTSSTLTVRQLDVDDFGSYSVTIYNTIGQPFVFYIEVESAIANVAKPESNVGPIIGGAIACVVVGAFGILAAIHLWRRYKGRRGTDQVTLISPEGGRDLVHTPNRPVIPLDYLTPNPTEQATEKHIERTPTNLNDPHCKNTTRV